MENTLKCQKFTAFEQLGSRADGIRVLHRRLASTAAAMADSIRVIDAAMRARNAFSTIGSSLR
jgi:hypothetical protein